jgi:hypothetical protein
MRRKKSVLVFTTGVLILADVAIGTVFKLKNLMPKCTRYGSGCFCQQQPFLPE